MTTRPSPIGAAVVALTAAALVVSLPFVPAPVRILVATAFFVAGPGLAWVPVLPVEGPIEQGAVAVALSLALDVLVAELAMFLGLPGLFPAALLLAAIALAGVAFDVRQAGRRGRAATRPART